jgi:nitrite reductase (NO-forming)
MPGQGANLSDEEIASVLTYVLNNFNNKGGAISQAEVKAVRTGSEPARSK